MNFEQHRELYRREHSTLGCKLTHMFGVPLIVASVIVLFFSWQWALGMFAFGWVLQFAGHFLFEGNKPVLFSDPSNKFTYFYAVIFVMEEWYQLITTGRLR